MSAHRIVVGYDGSPDSVTALQWAADQARRMHALLVVVHSYDFPYLERLDPATRERIQSHAEDVAIKALDSLRTMPDVSTELTVVSGDPARSLLDAAAGADMLVVGQHGDSRAHHWVGGSTTNRCVHHSTCPVVVVPAE